MTTHGRSGLGRWLYGSVAEAVLSNSTIPVLLVRAGLASTDLRDVSGKPRLLVPLDGSPTAEQALPVAASLARVLDAEIVLVRIVPSAPASITHESLRLGNVRAPRPSDAYEREAETYLRDVAQRLEAEGLSVATAVGDDHPPTGIATAGEQLGAALIIMATHGRTGLGRFVLGSVAHDVLRQATRPILLIRSSAAAAPRPNGVATPR
jgi:nucleotide-binding universal stress UspA family protein